MMDNPRYDPPRFFDEYLEDSTDDENSEPVQVNTDCDVNARNRHGKTLLHVAVEQSNVEDAKALLKLGADINAQTETDKKTPLCIATCRRKLRRSEMVCMLLYYGADVSITDVKGRTPYMIASEGTRRSRAEVSPFLREDPSYPDSICGAGVEKFKLFWSKFDQVVTKFQEPLMNDYIENAIGFTSAEWLDCLYMVLSSSIARQLIADAEARSKCGSCMGDFFVKLLESFQARTIGHEDRMALICLLLDLGATIHIQCVALVHREYGFSEEFKAIIYCADFCKSYRCSANICQLSVQMAHFLCPTEELFDEEILCSFFLTPGTHISSLPQGVVYLLGFFSLSPEVKEQLTTLVSPGFYRHWYNTATIIEKLETIPEFPSLVELSRNQTRNCIWQKLTVKKPYRFYDEIKMLGLTKTIEDIICYTQPLY